MVIKTILKKRKWKKVKWLYEEALQIAEEIREAKGNAEKERYTRLNAKLQRITRSYKKAFLNDWCKEIEENNKMGKKRYHFKKIRYQGNISCKDGHNKGQKWYGPNRREDTKKRWQEYTEELYKKDLHDPDNHNAVITHLEPDILECEVKWALGSITTNKASEVIESWLSYFKSRKMMLWKCFTQYASKFGNLSRGHRTGKGQFSFQSQRKTTPKNVQTTTRLHSSHTLAK